MTQPMLAQWVIYDHPSDYPEHVVVREWHIFAGDDVRACASVYRCDSLSQARQYINAIDFNLVRIPRDPTDDPVILETWI